MADDDLDGVVALIVGCGGGVAPDMPHVSDIQGGGTRGRYGWAHRAQKLGTTLC